MAKWLSTLTSAPLVAIPVFLFINFLVSGTSFILFSALSILFAGVIPILLTLFWSKIIKKIPYDIPEKGDRNLLLPAVVISYLAGTICLFILHASWLVTGLMICYCTNTFVVLIINLVWKISIHAMGTAGPMTAVIFAVGWQGLLLVFLLIPVMWSRVHLRRHTVAQVVGGAALGFLLTGVQLYLLRPVLG